MKINNDIFKLVEKADAQVLVVTKYFEVEESREIFEKVRSEKSFLACGENRIEDLVNKNLPREKVHFIGKLQSKKIPKIFKSCSAVHSLERVNHAQILNLLAEQLEEKFAVFLQINISEEPQKSGILLQDFENFLVEISGFKNLEILGISAIGAGEFTLKEKEEEFLLLKKLRDDFLPGKKISAGTSRDFEIALAQKIEVVRVGRALFEF